MKQAPPIARAIGLVILLGFGAVLVWAATRKPEIPASRKIVAAKEEIDRRKFSAKDRADARLVRQLLEENLDDRSFSFPTIVLATSEKVVIPLQADRPSHQRVLRIIEAAVSDATEHLSKPGSPVRDLRRINEASRHFEDHLLEHIDAIEGVRCEIPSTRAGKQQRAGYPDLVITDEESGDVFYLDPKLLERTNWKSSLRSFYFEPREETLKINDHAVHLLVGISHDGQDGAWTFGESKIVDLSTLKVRLKAEFQASNADLYQDSAD